MVKAKFKVGEKVALKNRKESIYRFALPNETGIIKLINPRIKQNPPSAKYEISGLFLDENFNMCAKSLDMYIEKISKLYRLFYL